MVRTVFVWEIPMTYYVKIGVVFQLFTLVLICSSKEVYRRNTGKAYTQVLKYGGSGLFDKIIKKEVPCDFLYEDDKCVVFDDIQPQAPEHFLVLPKKKIVCLALASESDAQILGHMMIVAKKVAAQKSMKSYRVVINNGRDTVQFTGQLHLHVLGGRVMHWPPG